jgi:hypothetical protein
MKISWLFDLAICALLRSIIALLSSINLFDAAIDRAVLARHLIEAAKCSSICPFKFESGIAHLLIIQAGVRALFVIVLERLSLSRQRPMIVADDMRLTVAHREWFNAS